MPFIRFVNKILLITALFIFGACSPVDFKGPENGFQISPDGTPPNNPPLDSGYPNDPPYYPQSSQCGGPVDISMYTGSVGSVRSQSQIFYSDYFSCESARQQLFGDALVCSKYVAATIMGCLSAKDRSRTVLEVTLALPVLTNGQLEVPYEYYLLGVPNCNIAAKYLNSNMGANIDTHGFTTVHFNLQAYCRNTTDLVIRATQIY